MRTELHPAYVLHQRAYRETSLILEVFSSQFGRIGLIARGARRSGTRRSAVPRPFMPLFMAWSGRGELPSLSLAEAVGTAIHLQGQRLISGLYLNELLLRLLPRHEAHAGLFEEYGVALSGLAGDAAEEPILRNFENVLIRAVGYGLILDQAVEADGPIRADHLYHYQADRGPWADKPDRSVTVPVHGATLLALQSHRLEDPTALREAKRLMRFVLSFHLGPTAIHSRELLYGPPQA